MGPDNLHPRLLSSCPSLAYPMFKIFVTSLTEGALPALWKLSDITPIFKHGTRSAPLNYRPISLTSVCCKALEKIVAEKINVYLEKHTILSPDQFGFRRGRTTDDQLLLTYNFVSSGLDAGYVVDVVLFDFSKAFDVVNHPVLLQKLQSIGITGSLLVWIASFLVGRSMRVSVAGVKSSPRDVKSGVPQGSVLGPLLFLLYVNYLPSSILNHCKIFADDLKIYLRYCPSSVVSLAVGTSSCQNDIDNICEVASSWGLDLNKKKCVVLRFQRGTVPWQHIGTLSEYFLQGHTITRVDKHKDLGVLVDSCLRFHPHIRSVVNKAAGMSANFLKSTLCRSQVFMQTLYKTHIRPLLEYASCVWNTGFLGDLRLLESVQRTWTRHIEGLSSLSYSERLRILDLYSVQGRLLRADLLKYWKIFHDECGISPEEIFTPPPSLATRGHRFKIHHTHSTTEARRRFFSLRCVSIWNSLPDQVVALESISSFKTALHHHLGPILYQFPD